MQIGGYAIGQGRTFIVSELGINHNGSVEIAKRLIDAAKASGADAVKFQKRTPELCVPRDQWEKRKETPWGEMSYIEYKRRMEFGEKEYAQIDAHCKAAGILWFASCWDAASLDFMTEFDPPCWKLASASITDLSLVDDACYRGIPVLMSTGMSTFEQVDESVNTFWARDLILLHCRSTYPAALCELNLNMIPTLKDRYGVPVGYSGHEVGIATSVAAVALGACVIERHLTLDRAMMGTDHAASLEPVGFARMVKDIRSIEQALGDGVTREYASEDEPRRKLRGSV